MSSKTPWIAYDNRNEMNGIFQTWGRRAGGVQGMWETFDEKLIVHFVDGEFTVLLDRLSDNDRAECLIHLRASLEDYRSEC